MTSPLILPGSPEFEATLGMSLPPGWQQEADRLSGEFAFVADAASGLLRPCSAEELEDYLWGGEYEERLINSGQEDVLMEFIG